MGAVPPGTSPPECPGWPYRGKTEERVSVCGWLLVASGPVCVDHVPDVETPEEQFSPTGSLPPPRTPFCPSPSSSPTSQVRNEQPAGEGAGPRVPGT